MQAAAGGVGEAHLHVQPLRRGEGVDVVGGGAVAARVVVVVEIAVEQQAHVCAAAGGVDQQLQAWVGVGDGVALLVAPVLVVTTNRHFEYSLLDLC